LCPQTAPFVSKDIKIFQVRICFFTLCVLNLFYIKITSQSLPRPSYITTEDGLSNRFVTSIIMDKRSLAWIGTAHGVERYDGVEFIKINDQKNADIYITGTNVAVSGVILKNDFTLWIVADDKLFSIDLCTNTWKEINLPEELIGKVLQIYKKGENEIYLNVSNADKILLVKYQEGVFSKQDSTGKAKINITSVSKDSKNNIWWTTPLDGIKILDKNFNLLKIIKPDSIDWYGAKIFSVPVFIDSKDRIFLFPKSVHELWQYFPDKDSVKVLVKGMESPFYNGLEDEQGNLWFHGRRQLIRLSSDSNGFQITDVTDHLGKNFNYTLIKQLYEDKSNILWIATNNGLIKLPIGPQLINNYLVIPDKEWGNEMRGIFESDNGDIYTYCENYTQGLHRINTKNQFTQLITHYFSQKKTYDVLYGGKKYCYHKRFNKAYFLMDDLLSVDLSNNQVVTEWSCSDITDKLDRNPIDFLGDSLLIMGSAPSKTTIYDPLNKKSIVRFNNLPGDVDIKNTCFAEDKYGNIWIGTNQGVYITSRKGELLHHIHSGSANAISNNLVLTILQDRNQNMWLGTLGGGVNLVKFGDNTLSEKNAENNFYSAISIEYINKEQGLCNENVPGILQDDFGYMWFSTYDGLSRYQADKRTFQTFITSDGISNNEFNYTSAFKDSKGNLWFGGLNGINKIDPGQIVSSNQTASMQLISFMKYNRNSKLQERFFISENMQFTVYEISPYDSWFQFNWTLPNYIKNEKNNYYVKLDGLNDSWQYNGNLAFIRYHNLAPGNYTLHIKGADSKGNWSPAEISVKIKVLPIFYETWWFRFLMLFLVSWVIFYIYKYNLNKKLEMERMRVRIASDLHDEVGSMLSGLAMQGELLSSESQGKEKLKLDKIADLSRDVVGKMRDLVWSIDSRSDTVQNLLDRMHELLEELLYPKEIAFQFVTGELPLMKELPVNVRQQLFLIYKEAVTNIVRHSNADHVYVYVGNKGDNFEMVLKDNGSPGIKSEHATGMGMRNMHMRAEKIDATFDINQTEGFKVTLRMKRI
jgi:ligand-binding sensor domain-containing protein/two-component sensor histidine kinase